MSKNAFAPVIASEQGERGNLFSKDELINQLKFTPRVATKFLTKIISFTLARFAFLLFLPIFFIYILFSFFSVALFKIVDFLVWLCVISFYAGVKL